MSRQQHLYGVMFHLYDDRIKNRLRFVCDSFSVDYWRSSRLVDISIVQKFFIITICLQSKRLRSEKKRKHTLVFNHRFICANIWSMFLFLGVFLVTIIVYFLRFHYEIVHAFYLSWKIDGPPALPIIGNGLLFLNNSSAGNFFLEN